MRILRAAERRAVPWKNGGGTTREIAVFPPGSDFATFLWRLSIAEVTQPGPFSHFENIDRHFAVLAGRVRLVFPHGTQDCDAHSEPIVFAGETPCHATPLDGPVTDLNLMLRRGRVQASMQRVSGRTRLGGGTSIVVAPQALSLRVGGRTVALEKHDAALFDEPCELDIGAPALIIAIP
ncbi:MAG: HutD family protein [Alphaproteobacteria bacterium]|nr:HutD family protein [Alphaproteobacteria bacterium]MBV9693915.1 HutD family protein [Alphaproteobacteria bacterium]